MMEFARHKVTKDLIVIGAGMPGICAAIQAARLGLSVALVNNRGVLGGNASPEIRVTVSGADGSEEFNFYARETGILEEIRLENLHRNPQGNPYVWETVLFDFIGREENIELFLNTNIDCVETDGDRIVYVSGSQQGSEKRFDFYGRFFVDNTGDGTVGYLAGAEHRMGREARAEFDEGIAPEEADEAVLPSTLTFYARDTGRPVPFKRPDFALDLAATDILQYRRIPERTKNRTFRMDTYRFQWYYEIPGRFNQIENSEKVMQMHRELVYGIWDYIKNSGKYDSETYDLEYVACIPGKRESRRLMGDYILTEKDLVEQRDFEDVVGHGGWSIDLHAIDGFFSKEVINKHYYLRGIYQIPYRTGYSKNVENLFMAGRCMSTSHVAFGSTRVMATLCTLAQAVGIAAYLCIKHNTTPRGIYEKHMKELQQLLLAHDQYVIGHRNEDPQDKAPKAKVTVSSTLEFALKEAENYVVADRDLGVILPAKDQVDSVKFLARVAEDTKLAYKVYSSRKKENYSPDVLVTSGELSLAASADFHWIEIPVGHDFGGKNMFVELGANAQVCLGVTTKQLPGVLLLSRHAIQSPTIWDAITLQRKEYLWRSMKHSPCFQVTPDQDIYGASNITNGYHRPYGLPNLWASADRVTGEYVTLEFDGTEEIREICFTFDSNLDARINNIEVEYEQNTIPEVVRDYAVYYLRDGKEYKLTEVTGNYQRVNRLTFDPVQADGIKVVFHKTNGASRVGLYEIRVY